MTLGHDAQSVVDQSRMRGSHLLPSGRLHHSTRVRREELHSLMFQICEKRKKMADGNWTVDTQENLRNASFSGILKKEHGDTLADMRKRGINRISATNEDAT